MKTIGVALLFFLISSGAAAFPENVRHGYFACTACHVSPSGGGVLTPYGRSLSAELMSTWGTTKTSGFMFSQQDDEGALKWLRSQILLRGIQTYRNNSAIEKAQFIPMQADLEIGADTETFALISTIGYRANDASKELKELFSRRHYALYRFSDQIVGRVGKFMQSFGLNGPDHYSATRRGLGWDQGSESYNLELNYLGEAFSHTVTLISNFPEDRGPAKDSGVSVNSSYFWNNKSRFGVSLFRGEQNASNRTVAGPYLTLSLNEHFYLSSEFFFQDKTVKASSSRERGYATFSRLGYEVLKGFTPFLQFDRSALNAGDRSSQIDSYGVGIQWLPYPHLDFMFFASKEAPYARESSDFAWLMFNIYL